MPATGRAMGTLASIMARQPPHTWVGGRGSIRGEWIPTTPRPPSPPPHPTIVPPSPPPHPHTHTVAMELEPLLSVMVLSTRTTYGNWALGGMMGARAR